jgi:hypothetical protein
LFGEQLIRVRNGAPLVTGEDAIGDGGGNGLLTQHSRDRALFVFRSGLNIEAGSFFLSKTGSGQKHFLGGVSHWHSCRSIYAIGLLALALVSPPPLPRPS